MSIKMKNCKTFCKAQIASYFKKIIQSPPIPPLSDKTLLRLRNMVQCKYIFWHQAETNLQENV